MGLVGDENYQSVFYTFSFSTFFIRFHCAHMARQEIVLFTCSLNVFYTFPAWQRLRPLLTFLYIRFRSVFGPFSHDFRGICSKTGSPGSWGMTIVVHNALINCPILHICTKTTWPCLWSQERTLPGSETEITILLLALNVFYTFSFCFVVFTQQ